MPVKCFLSSQKVEIDIHGMMREDAKRYLERFLSGANGNIREVTVIHGYCSGTVLQQMVRHGLRHHRIAYRSIGLNPGTTTLFLKPGQ